MFIWSPASTRQSWAALGGDSCFNYHLLSEGKDVFSVNIQSHPFVIKSGCGVSSGSLVAVVVPVSLVPQHPLEQEGPGHKGRILLGFTGGRRGGRVAVAGRAEPGWCSGRI